MGNFKVTVPGGRRYTGEVADVAFAHGVATVDDATSEGRRALAYFRRKGGYLVEPIEDAEDAEAPVDEEPKAPSRKASKGDWLAYAISQGMPDADAEAATRDDLAERYLGPKEA